MKDCKDCEFFFGYDYSDGTPDCTIEGGYTSCPYNDMAELKKTGMKVEFDTDFIREYIIHTMKNTIENSAVQVASDEVKKLVTDELKSAVLAETKSQIKEIVAHEIEVFMAGTITIGGGWSEPKRELTRSEYLAECVQDTMQKNCNFEVIKNSATSEANKAINNYAERLRKDVNAGVKECFDAATRATLTDSIVTMLMENDTYRKLSASMQTFLPDGGVK